MVQYTLHTDGPKLLQATNLSRLVYFNSFLFVVFFCQWQKLWPISMKVAPLRSFSFIVFLIYVQFSIWNHRTRWKAVDPKFCLKLWDLALPTRPVRLLGRLQYVSYIMTSCSLILRYYYLYRLVVSHIMLKQLVSSHQKTIGWQPFQVFLWY